MITLRTESMKECHPHPVHRSTLQPRHVGTDDRRRKQRQTFQRIHMSRPGSLRARHGASVQALLAYLGPRGAARVGVIPTTVGAAADEEGAVKVRAQAEDVEGGDGVDGVVCCAHFGEVLKVGAQYDIRGLGLFTYIYNSTESKNLC